MKKSKVYSLPDDEFRALIARSKSVSDCLRALGLCPRGGRASDELKKRARTLGVVLPKYNPTKDGGAKKKIPLEDILVKNSSYLNIGSLKRRLLIEGVKEYRCECCGIQSWQNKPLSLQLDHINGDHTDHRIENLRFLCPNCHSQTSTFSGKNK